MKAGIAAGELRPEASPSLVRDLVFGCIEHRTWAFLRGEGNFDPAEMADAITNLVHHGLMLGSEPNSPMESVITRLEAAAARLEATTGIASAKTLPASRAEVIAYSLPRRPDHRRRPGAGSSRSRPRAAPVGDTSTSPVT